MLTYSFTSIGVDSLKSIVASDSNIAIGDSALLNNGYGSNNVAIGTNSMLVDKDPNCSVAIGYNSLANNSEIDGNVAIGCSAGENSNVPNSVYIGARSGLIDLGEGSTFVGYESGLNNVGNYNTLLGNSAGYTNTSGDNLTFIGWQSGYGNTTGDDNTSIGKSANQYNQDGSGNIAIGVLAGSYIADGVNENTSPNGSIYIGNNTKSFNVDDTNSIVIGNNVTSQGDNTIVIGNTDNETIYLNGDINVNGTNSTSFSVNDFGINSTSTISLTTDSLGLYDSQGNGYNLTTTSGQNGQVLTYANGNATWENASGDGNVTGSGTLNYIPKWSGSTGLRNSVIFDNGSTVSIGYNNLLINFTASANTFNLGKGGSTESRALFMGKSIPSTWTGSSVCGQFDFNNPGGDQGVVIKTNAGYVGTGSTPVAGGIISVQGNAKGIIFAGNPTDENHLVIDRFGKVGIGTNIPTKRLTVSGDSNFIGIAFATDFIASESLQGNDIFPTDDVDLNISTRTDTGTKNINLMTGPNVGGLGYTRMTITSGGTVGIGTTNPNPFTLNQSDGKLHVKSGDSGVTGGTGGSTVVIEASTTNYLSMYSPDANVSGIVFGSNSDAFGSFIRWGHDQGKLQIATANIDDYIEFGVGNYSFNTYITNTGFGINTLPSQSLHVSGNTLLQGNLTATTISATTYLNLPYNGTVGGSGSSNYVTKWGNGVDITDSLIYDDGSFVGIGASTSTNNEVFSVQMGGPVAFNNVTIYDRSDSLAIGFDDYTTWGTSGNEIAIGGGANLLSSTGQYNVSIGYSSLRDNDTGSQNTSVGYSSLRMNISGARNTSIGMSSLNANESGDYNTSIGYLAMGTNVHGSNNVAIGGSAGYSSVGNNNTFIGFASGQNYSGNSSIFIGNNVEDSQNLLIDSRFYLGRGIDDILLYGKLDTKQLGINKLNFFIFSFQ